MDLRLKHLGVRTVLSGVPPSTTIADLKFEVFVGEDLEVHFEWNYFIAKWKKHIASNIRYA